MNLKEIKESITHLNFEELNSLMKSNRLGWDIRKGLKGTLAVLAIKDFIPAIAMIGVGTAMLNIMMRMMNEIEKDT